MAWSARMLEDGASTIYSRDTTLYRPARIRRIGGRARQRSARTDAIGPTIKDLDALGAMRRGIGADGGGHHSGRGGLQSFRRVCGLRLEVLAWRLACSFESRFHTWTGGARLPQPTVVSKAPVLKICQHWNRG